MFYYTLIASAFFFLPLSFCCITFLQQLIIRWMLSLGFLEFRSCPWFWTKIVKCPLTPWDQSDLHQALAPMQSPSLMFYTPTPCSLVHILPLLVFKLLIWNARSYCSSQKHFRSRTKEKWIFACSTWVKKQNWKAVVGVSHCSNWRSRDFVWFRDLVHTFSDELEALM